MARTKSPVVIGGLASVNAVRRAANSGNAQQFKTRPSATTLPKEKQTAAGQKNKSAVASHANRTAMPVKHELLCYECSYAFKVSGMLKNIICPKCRTALCSHDITIDTTWSKSVKTIANVIITETGIVKPCEIVASDVTIAGDAREVSSIKTGRMLNIDKGAKIDFSKIEFKDLAVKAGAKISFKEELFCNDAEIAGTIKGPLVSEGTVTIKAGGLLQGSLQGVHLIIEDGGGLKASLNIEHDEEELKDE